MMRWGRQVPKVPHNKTARGVSKTLPVSSTCLLGLAAQLIGEGRSVKEVAKTFGVHKATIYRTTIIETP